MNQSNSVADMHQNNPRQVVSSAMDGDMTEQVEYWLKRAHEPDSIQDRAWDEYHYIGDLLRSTDLLSRPSEQDFMVRFSAQFAAEPVFLPQKKNRQQSSAWTKRMLPSAAAAAAVVAVVWTLTGPFSSDQELSQAGRVIAAKPMQSPLAKKEAAAEVQLVATQNGAVARDTRFDEYLEAHQQLAPRAPIMGAGLVIRTTAAVAP